MKIPQVKLSTYAILSLMLSLASIMPVMAQVTLTTSPYSENFNTVASGLPTGWTVRTGATASALGTAATLTTTAQPWNNTTGNFRNAASVTGLTSAASSTDQSNSSNRALAVRQTGTFGDAGAAFVLQLANTTNITSLNLTFKLMQLDPGTAGRTVTWTVDYGFGTSPTSFTNATTAPATISTTQGSAGWGSTDVTVNFGNALDNKSENVWIRVSAKTASTGSGSRPHTAIDDVSLSFTPAASAPSITSALTASATVGTSFSYNITASGTVTSYDATGLPSGLSINTSTGAITGTPASGTVGSHNVSISATNANGSDTKTLVITVGKAAQTITFNTLDTKTFGDIAYSISASSTSGLGVSFSSSNTSVATVSGNTITIVGAGSTDITASQSGNDDYAAATNVVRTLTVNKAAQTITFAALSQKTTDDAPFQLGATTTSGLTISYSSSNTNVATISGNTVTIVGEGTTTITASQSGNTNYNAATSVERDLLVVNATKQNQTITFNALSAVTYGDGTFNLGATSSSGLTVSYSSSNTAVATVSGNTVTIVGPGTTTITASQAGNSSYNAAADVDQGLTVNKKTLTVTGATAANKTYDGSTTATISGATLVGIVGSDVVTVSGGGSFADANAGDNKAVTAALSLGGADAAKYLLSQPTGLTANITKADQTITFSTDSIIATYSTTPIALTGTASSGLTVTYTSSDTTVAAISGSTIVLKGGGIATITASQEGNDNYNAATSVQRGIRVSKASQFISGFSSASVPRYRELGASNHVITGVTVSSGLTPTFSSSNTSAVTVSDSTLSFSGVGSSNITATQAGNSAYNSVTSSAQTVYVTQPVLGAWNTSALTTSTSPFAATSTASNITIGSLTRGSSVTQTNISRGWGGTGFNFTTAALAVGSNRFFTFTAKPSTGYVANFQSFILDYRRSSTGPQSMTIQYSTDGSNFSDISTVALAENSTGTPVGLIDLTSITALQNVPAATTVTFRLVPFGASAAGGTFYIFDGGSSTDRDMSINGTVALEAAPVITSSLTATGTMGSSFSYNITATNAATSYSATGLPTGLSINTSTGAITGTPASGTVGEHNVTITATNAGGTDTETLVLTINKAAQTITFAALGGKTYGDAAFDLTATSTSGLTVSFSSSNTNVATISGINLSIVGGGSSDITATQEGNADYLAATAVVRTLTVNKANQTITFNALADKTTADGPFALGATTTSGLTISYSSSNTNVATISGNIVTIVGSGTTTITASQAGNSNYNAASSVQQTLLVNDVSKDDQTITFNTLSARTYGDGTFTLGATASSGLTVSYTSSNTAVATVSGSTVTIVGPGSTTITATQNGNDNYNPADPVQQSLTINKKTLTVSGAVAQNKVYDGTTDATITGATLVGVVGSDVVTVSGNGTFATADAGTNKAVTTSLSLGGADAGKYLLTQPSGLTATISKASQTITFAALPAKTTGDAAFALTATASSGLTVTYTSGTPSVASVSGNMVTLVSAGSTIITASQAGNNNYNAATPVQQTQTVTVASSQIKYSFSDLTGNATTVATSVTASAMTIGNTLGTVTAPINSTTASTGTGASGGNNIGNAARVGALNTAASGSAYIEFSLTPAAQKKVTVSGLNLFTRSSSTGPTALSIRTSKDGFTNTVATTTFTTGSWISKTLTPFTSFSTDNSTPVTIRIYGHSGSGSASNNTINWRLDDISVDVAVEGAAPVVNSALTATAKVGAAFNYTIAATNAPDQFNATGLPAGLSVNTSTGVISGTPTAVGTHNIQITAASVYGTSTKTLVLTIAKGNQTITFPALAARTMVDDKIVNPGATTSSGLVVSYASNNGNVAKVVNGQIIIVGAGRADITAYQRGNANYNAAPSVRRLLIVSEKYVQTVTINAIPSKEFGDPSFFVTASASTGLPVSYSSSNSSIASVNSVTGEVTIHSGGTAYIIATQAGNDSFAMASAKAVLNVGKKAQVITFGPIPAKSYGDGKFDPGATVNSPYTIVYKTSNSSIASITSDGRINIRRPGTVTVTASQPGGRSYSAATPVSQVLVISKGIQAIMAPAIPNQTVGTSYKYIVYTASGKASLTSSNPAVVEVKPGHILLCKKPGTVTITVRHSGNAYYNSASTTVPMTVVAGAGRPIDAAEIVANNPNNPVALPPVQVPVVTANTVKPGVAIKVNVVDNANAGSEDRLDVYPNPVRTQATLRFKAEKAGKAVIRLIDINGRPLLQQEAQVVIGTNTVSLPAATLKQGTYYILLSVDGKQLKATMLKIE